MMKCFPESGHNGRTANSAAALGLFYSRRDLDNPVMDTALRPPVSKIPTMVTAFDLMRKGNDPVRPRDDGLLRQFSLYAQ